MKTKLLFILLMSFIIGCSSPNEPEPTQPIAINVTNWEYSPYVVESFTGGEFTLHKINYAFTVSNFTDNDIQLIDITFKYLETDSSEYEILFRVEDLFANSSKSDSSHWFARDSVISFEYVNYEN